MMSIFVVYHYICIYKGENRYGRVNISMKIPVYTVFKLRVYRETL